MKCKSAVSVFVASVLLVAASPSAMASNTTGSPKILTGPSATFTLDSIQNSKNLKVYSSEEVNGTSSRLGSAGVRALKKENPNTNIVMLQNSDEKALADVSLADSVNGDKIMYAATDKYIDLSWENVPKITQYEIFKDGKTLGVINGNSYRDSQVESGKRYDYRIVSIIPKSLPPDYEARTWGMNILVPQPINTQSIQDGVKTQAATAQSLYRSSVLWNTFIPQQYIDAPPAGCAKYSGSKYVYDGSNRGFRADGYPYKTKLFGDIIWDQNGRVNTYVSNGDTKVRLKSNKQLLATQTASESGLSVKRQPQTNSATAYLRMDVHSTNPFCGQIPNAIDGAMSITVTRSGTWSITSGEHRQMPNHEIYIYRYNVGWTTAYQRSYANTACLVAQACERANMTGFYGYY